MQLPDCRDAVESVDVQMTDETGLPNDGLEAAAAVFAQQRRRLFGIAYRMLGTVADAEDIVQDAWIRWQTTDRSQVKEPAAFLATITTRLSINVLQSSRVRRETYIGPWLPEPVNTDDDPALGAERAGEADAGRVVCHDRGVLRGLCGARSAARLVLFDQLVPAPHAEEEGRG